MRKIRVIKVEVEFECPATDKTNDVDKVFERLFKTRARVRSNRVISATIEKVPSKVNQRARRHNEYGRIFTEILKSTGLTQKMGSHGWGCQTPTFTFNFFGSSPILTFRCEDTKVTVCKDPVTIHLGFASKVIDLASPGSHDEIANIIKAYGAVDLNKLKCPSCGQLTGGINERVLAPIPHRYGCRLAR